MDCHSVPLAISVHMRLSFFSFTPPSLLAFHILFFFFQLVKFNEAILFIQIKTANTHFTKPGNSNR